MKTTYTTTVLGFGNHAAFEIPDKNLQELGGSKRSPLKITVAGYSYQSTATAMDGKTLVVFPTKDRLGAGVTSGDKVIVIMELQTGYREVAVPAELAKALKSEKLDKVFRDLSYSKRKEFARKVDEAKTKETKTRRIKKTISDIGKFLESKI